jgi:hypothetical protein
MDDARKTELVEEKRFFLFFLDNFNLISFKLKKDGFIIDYFCIEYHFKHREKVLYHEYWIKLRSRLSK